MASLTRSPPAGTPVSEFPIDADLAHRLLAAQHPDLADLPIRFLASGWDNVTFRLGDDLTLRLPRRQAAATLVEHEQRWLPHLQHRLPLPIPAPVRTGAPQGDYPWAWSISPWLKGETADLAPPNENQGEVLAGFFEALHQPAPAEAPRNPVRGVPLAQRLTVFETRQQNLAGRSDLIDERILAVWADALAAPDDARDTWIHGDPHPRNVLVAEGRICAVIDWGDVGQGDRASDLAAVWMLLPGRESRRRAMAACRTVSADTWRRARGWAVHYAVMLLDTGLTDDPRMAAIAKATIERLIEGP